MKQKDFLMLFLSAFLFALSTPLSKILLEQNNPLFLASLFYIGAALGLLPFYFPQFLREIRGLKNEKKDFLKLTLSILSGGILAPISLLFGIKYANASTAALFFNFEFLLTSLIAFAFFHEHLGKRFILSASFAIIAGITLTIPQTLEFQKGLFFVFLACFFWGLDNNFAATMRSISPQTNTMTKGIVGGSINLGLLLLIGEKIPTLKMTHLGALVIGALSYGLSIMLYIRGARTLGAARSQMIFSLNPFVAVVLSYFLLKEEVGAIFYISFALMLLSVLILYFERHHHEHEHEEEEHIHEHTHDDDHHFHEHPELSKNVRHTHKHKHESLKHTHTHFPDIHHRHVHK